jgi:mRNA interferase MazF
VQIELGNIYFIRTSEDKDEIIHPYIIYEKINENEYSICMISTNMKKAYWPGNIILSKEESGLPKRSIVVVSKTVIIKKDKFEMPIGRINQERLLEVKREIANLNEKLESRIVKG